MGGGGAGRVGFERNERFEKKVVFITGDGFIPAGLIDGSCLSLGFVGQFFKLELGSKHVTSLLPNGNRTDASGAYTSLFRRSSGFRWVTATEITRKAPDSAHTNAIYRRNPSAPEAKLTSIRLNPVDALRNAVQSAGFDADPIPVATPPKNYSTNEWFNNWINWENQ